MVRPANLLMSQIERLVLRVATVKLIKVYDEELKLKRQIIHE